MANANDEITPSDLGWMQKTQHQVMDAVKTYAPTVGTAVVTAAATALVSGYINKRFAKLQQLESNEIARKEAIKNKQTEFMFGALEDYVRYNGRTSEQVRFLVEKWLKNPAKAPTEVQDNVYFKALLEMKQSEAYIEEQG